MTHHWTDTAPAPVFSTIIPTRGPAGNIFVILATATQRLRQLNIPRDRIGKLQEQVMSANSYDEACAYVARWFPLEIVE